MDLQMDLGVNCYKKAITNHSGVRYFRKNTMQLYTAREV